MGLIQTSRQSTGGGGGGSVNWHIDRFTQTTPFLSGGVQITLTHIPTSAQAISLTYNGIVLQNGIDYSLAGGIITILFGDPTTDYDNPVVFQAQYTY